MLLRLKQATCACSGNKSLLVWSPVLIVTTPFNPHLDCSTGTYLTTARSACMQTMLPIMHRYEPAEQATPCLYSNGLQMMLLTCLHARLWSGAVHADDATHHAQVRACRTSYSMPVQQWAADDAPHMLARSAMVWSCACRRCYPSCTGTSLQNKLLHACTAMVCRRCSSHACTLGYGLELCMQTMLPIMHRYEPAEQATPCLHSNGM